jgi:hypothetical protein
MREVGRWKLRAGKPVAANRGFDRVQPRIWGRLGKIEPGLGTPPISENEALSARKGEPDEGMFVNVYQPH